MNPGAQLLRLEVLEVSINKAFLYTYTRIHVYIYIYTLTYIQTFPVCSREPRNNTPKAMGTQEHPDLGFLDAVTKEDQGS